MHLVRKLRHWWMSRYSYDYLIHSKYCSIDSFLKRAINVSLHTVSFAYSIELVPFNPNYVKLLSLYLALERMSLRKTMFVKTQDVSGTLFIPNLFIN